MEQRLEDLKRKKLLKRKRQNSMAWNVLEMLGLSKKVKEEPKKKKSPTIKKKKKKTKTTKKKK